LGELDLTQSVRLPKIETKPVATAKNSATLQFSGRDFFADTQPIPLDKAWSNGLSVLVKS